MREESLALSFTQNPGLSRDSGRNWKHLLEHSPCYWKDNKFIVFEGSGRDEKPFSELGILTLSERNAGNSHCYPDLHDFFRRKANSSMGDSPDRKTTSKILPYSIHL